MIRIFLHAFPQAVDQSAAPVSMKRLFLDKAQLVDALVDVQDGDILLACREPSFEEAAKLADDLADTYKSVFCVVERYGAAERPHVVYLLRSLEGVSLDELISLCDSTEFSMISRLVRLAKTSSEYQMLFDLGPSLVDPHEGRRLTDLLVKEISQNGFDLGAYQEKVSEVNYPDKGESVKYPLLGFVEELGEVIEKLEQDPSLAHIRTEEAVRGVLKEIGDALWYGMNFCTEVGIDFTGVEQLAKAQGHRWSSGDLLSLSIEMARLAGLVGKADRDDKGIITSKRQAAMTAPLVEIVSRLMALARELNSSLEEVALMNNDKLEDRRRRDVISGSGDER